MGRPSPSFQKRQRERKKQLRREDKARKRAEWRADKAENPDPEVIELSDIVGPDPNEVPEDDEEEGEDEDDKS